MKNFFILVILLTLTSCSFLKKGVEIKVVNNTSTIISNIKCYTSENTDGLLFENINSNTEVSGFLSMDKNKADGHYIIEFTSEKGEVVKYNKGYYSNGIPLNNELKFEILNDSVVFKQY